MKYLIIILFALQLFSGCAKDRNFARNYTAIEFVDRRGEVYTATVNTAARTAAIDSLPEIFELVKVRYKEGNAASFTEEPAKRFLGKTVSAGTKITIELPGRFDLSVAHLKRASVGYIYLSDAVFDTKFSAIRWNAVSHVIAGFLRTSASGDLSMNETPEARIRQLVEVAHQNGVKVIIGVGSDNDNGFVKAISSAAGRHTLASNLVNFVNTHGFDGIDVDFEVFDQLGSPNLPAFFREVSAIKGDRFTLSAAVSYYGEYSSNFSSDLDFVNLMAYDLNEGLMKPIATYEQCISFIDKWRGYYNTAGYRLMLGMPFYGYSFDHDKVSWTAPYGLANQIRYYDILKVYPGENAWEKDRINNTFYNGIPTIKKKSEYVLNNGIGGVMLWNLLMDSDEDNFSLLKNINDVLKNY